MKGDPPLGACPPWCQKPAGHDWEDLWTHGLIRYHTYRVQLNKWHAVGIDEIEMALTVGGHRRMRQVVLDVEAPTNLTRDELVAFEKAMIDVGGKALIDWPEGEPF